MSSIASKIAAAGAAKNKMSAADFIIENNPHGYANRESLKEYLSDEPNNNRVEGLLEFMVAGVGINNLLTISYDRKEGYEIIFVRPGLAKGDPLVLIKNVDRMINFLKDYQLGKITPAFTLPELYEAVCKEDVVTN